MQYAIVIEKGQTSYGAYVPDLPGCVAVGETIEEVRAFIQEAIAELDDICRNFRLVDRSSSVAILQC